ncbi:MAG: phosphoglucosamine mutase [Fibrobacter sp.]|jgi:phosphomannomutase|nr:phosphoglucosamine mutase [Fibrobacter sp.]
MSVLMRSVSGIRGIVGDSLTPAVLLNHVKAFLEVTQAKKIVIGRDSRPTGDAIIAFVTGVCRLSGVEVIEAGLSTTPTVEVLVPHFKAGGGIIITASHNPIEWNALKFLNQDGLFLGPKEVKTLFEIADRAAFAYPDYRGMGSVSHTENTDDIHIRQILEIPFIDAEMIRAAHLKVAVDAVNGAGSLIAPKLLESLGCEVTAIHCDPEKPFPRGAEPLPENLKDLSRAVTENHCAVGFALDPDADRCALVNSKGEPAGEEYTLVIAAEEVLSQKQAPHCINLSTSRMNEDVAEKWGVPCFRAPVGEINVSLAMMEHGCVIGGEGNGGVILPATHYGRDSLVAIALVLSWMARRKLRVEDFAEQNPRYVILKKKFAVGKTSVENVFSQIREDFSGWKEDARDGLWLGKEKCWVHVRASNTEPVIRVIAEAPDEAEAEKLCRLIERRMS